MNRSLSSIWNQAVHRLASDLADPALTAWLDGARPVSLEQGALVIELPNAFCRDWVEARYLEPLREVLRDVAGQPWELQLVLPNHSPNHRSRSSRTPRPGNTPSWSVPLLNPRYTFDTFVVGPSNRFAHAASLAVSEAPGGAYNPLFIYGGVGLGKTHLMQAIGHYVHQRHRHLRVAYVSSEQFTNELIGALGQKAMPSFRDRYRTVDVLLIDDIQFVAGKESTQEEFFHTFNALYEANKQIVISSDRPPKDIPTLEERLRSRFEWGLTADIQAPDLETRIAILRRKAAAERYKVPGDVLAYIAKEVDSNIRELEGALIRVLANAAMTHRSLTVDLAQEVLRDLVAARHQRAPTIASIQQAVAAHFQLRPDELTSRRRTRAVVFPRQLAMYLARELTDASLPRIGEEFGGRDHTTVLHACEKIRADLSRNASLQATLRNLIEQIRHG